MLKNHISFLQKIILWDKKVLTMVTRYQRQPFILILRILCRIVDPIIAIILLAILMMAGVRQFSELVSIGMAFSSFVALVIKKLVSRERPHLDRRASKPPDPYSFPSGHATVTFTSVIMLWSVYPQLQMLFLALALLVCFARIYLGVHYPTDVLGGIIVGILSGFVLRYLFTLPLIVQYMV